VIKGIFKSSQNFYLGAGTQMKLKFPHCHYPCGS